MAYNGPGEPTPNVAEAQPAGSFTQSRMLVPQDLDMLARGMKPTYYARWAGYSDPDGTNVSAWSLPMSMAIAVRPLANAGEDGDASDGSLKLAA